jgi:tight adherence protein B
MSGALIAAAVLCVAGLALGLGEVLVSAPPSAGIRAGSMGRGLLAVRRGVLAARTRTWSQERSVAHEIGEVRRLAASVRSGSPVGRALDELAVGGGPWAPPAGRVVAEVARGRRLHAALDAWAVESNTPGPALVSSAVALAEASGGSTAEALDAVARSLAERAELHREVAAASSSARASAGVLVVIPLVFAVVVAVADPRVGQVLVATPLGLTCVALGLLLDLGGAAWMRRLVRQVLA